MQYTHALHPCTARMHCTHALHAGTGRMHCAHALHACVCVRVCVESALWWLPERTTPTSRFFLPGGGGGHALLVRARATSVMRCTCAPRAPTCFPSAPRQTVLRCTRAPSAQPHFAALLLRNDRRAPRATLTRTPSATHPRGTPFSPQRGGLCEAHRMLAPLSAALRTQPPAACQTPKNAFGNVLVNVTARASVRPRQGGRGSARGI